MQPLTFTGEQAVQQQGGPFGSLSFSSQFGTFTVDSLPLLSPAPATSMHVQMQAPLATPQAPIYQAPPSNPLSSNQGSPQSQADVFSALERLGQLHQSGILSDEEFRAKKAELLARL